MKACVFQVFAKEELPRINSNAKAADVEKWKKNPDVLKCYKKLFCNIDEDDEESEIYMFRIINSVWPRKDIPDLHVAWAVSIAELLLDPQSDGITITEDNLQPKLKINLVSNLP